MSVDGFTYNITMVSGGRYQFDQTFGFSVTLCIRLFFPFFADMFGSTSSPSSSVVEANFSTEMKSRGVLSTV